MSLRKLFRPMLALLLLLPAGCAKSPSTGSSSPVSGPQLIVTMTVAGNINPNYYYYILFNVNNTPGPNNSAVTGPVPVVATPYGNGYAAGAFTNYVEYNSGQPGGTNFNYYAVDPTLFNSQPLGQARLIQAQTVGSTLTFQLPLAYLATANVTAPDINSLQVNFITTNVVPVNGQNISTAKYFDALYPPQQAGNSYVNLIIRDANGTLLANTFTNNGSGVSESSGDVAQYVNGVPEIVSGTTPDGVTTNDLDITNWTIQLTSGS
jgi:hypothetical protein